MPNDNPSSTEQDGNLQAILDHIKKQDEKIDKLTSNMSKVIEFNTNLLNNKPAPEVDNSSKSASRHDELWKKLLGGIK